METVTAPKISLSLSMIFQCDNRISTSARKSKLLSFHYCKSFCIWDAPLSCYYHMRLDASTIIKVLSTSLVFNFKLLFLPALISETPWNLLRLKADKAQGVIMTTSSSAATRLLMVQCRTLAGVWCQSTKILRTTCTSASFAIAGKQQLITTLLYYKLRLHPIHVKSSLR